MPYVIIDPVNMTYDGGYFDKDDAESMLEHCRKEYAQPSIFMAFIDGVASTTLEPHFTWMADKEVRVNA